MRKFVIALTATGALVLLSPAIDASAATTTSSVSVLTPTAGEAVGEDITFTGDAPSGSTLAYWVSGPEGTEAAGSSADAAAGYAVEWTAPGPGDYDVTASVCVAGETPPNCNGDPSADIAFSVIEMKPAVLSHTAAFSPNGDGHFDSMTLSYSLDEASQPVLILADNQGNVVDGVRMSNQPLAAGDHTYHWDGRGSDGSRFADGTYRLILATARDLSDSREYGFAGAGRTRLDTHAPALSSVGTDGRLFIVHDGYRDRVKLLATSDEAAKFTFDVRTLSGQLLRRSTVNRTHAGTATVSWDGTDRHGRQVKPGTYTMLVSANDALGNKSATRSRKVVVDPRRLELHTATRRVSPTGSQQSTLENDCNRVWDNFDPHSPGSLDLDSEAGCTMLYVPNVAATENAYTLPSAIKYGHITVSVTGTGLDGSRVLLQLTDSSWYGGYGSVLTKAGSGTSSTHSVPFSKIGGGPRVRWVLAADDGDNYVAKSFTLTWTYYTLHA